MRTATVMFVALGALLVQAAPRPEAMAIGAWTAQAAERPKKAARSSANDRAAFPPPRFSPPDTAALTPSFTRTKRSAPFALIRAAPNPLVSAEYRGTDEYEYLYTPASALRSPPPVARYAYARDFGYLLRPFLAVNAAAAAYAWRDTPLQLLRSSVGSTAKALRPDLALMPRNPGQKIDNGLRPYSVLPADQKGLAEAAPGRDEAFVPIPRSRVR